MQHSAIHDPYEVVTLLQRLEVTARRERLARFEAAARRRFRPEDCFGPKEPSGPVAPPIPNQMLEVALDILERANPIPMGQVETIQRAVIERYPAVTLNDLKSARREAAVVRPRQIAMYLAKELTTRSLPDIGRRFGGRDHTTVLHAVRKIGALVKKDPALAAEIEGIKSSLAEAAL
jgi:hypothetical protein